VDPIKALMLGLLQGVLEWLPVSSQGNLVVLAIAFLGLEPEYALSLSVYLHLGTGLAALVYFRNEVVGILGRRTDRDRELFRFLLMATIVTGAVGFPIFAFVRLTSLYGEALLALTGLALLDRESDETRAQIRLDVRDGLSLGVVQGLSAIPGLSRSGVTTTALLLKDFPSEEALRLSFLMSIPASFAAATGQALIEGAPTMDTGILLALAASFISALVSIDLLIKLARRTRFWKLCVVLGLIALVAVLPYIL
jgi:undecaprenyl-diphosphatase